jgi:hypothetical protein
MKMLSSVFGFAMRGFVSIISDKRAYCIQRVECLFPKSLDDLFSSNVKVTYFIPELKKLAGDTSIL